MARQHKDNRYTLWQWNCRGYRRKRAVLQQLLIGKDCPDVIALQETGGIAKLSGYQSFNTSGEKAGVTTLVKRNITAIAHDTGISHVEHVLLELTPNNKIKTSLFVLNIYSSPKQRKTRFGSLLQKTLRIANKQAVVVMGDFNAHHAAWGYQRECVKGRELWLDMQQGAFTLLTDPQSPTRTGNSVSTDTSPDLTLVKNIGSANWVNTQENLGSDHFILETVITAGPYKRPGRRHSLVEWDAFRKIREQSANTTEIDDIEEWIKQLQLDARKATKTVAEDSGLETMDTRLLHMWQAKTSMEKRLKSQKWNRNLRRRIARHNKEIEEYALKLSRQNWESLCDKMDGNISLARTWSLLRYLLDPDECKTAQRQNLHKIQHKHEGTEQELLDEIRSKYIGDTEKVPLHGYCGIPNDRLDEPITESEVRAELARLNTNSAPGPDGVSNKLLRNLDDNSITALTAYMQKCWEAGEIPRQWKSAKVVLIPKPGKPLSIENLRPISLTSCAGKLMEHVVQTRLNNYMEDHHLYPISMVGFRSHLSTQDVMLQLKHEILDSQTRDTKVILGLDLAKAFDNVTHKAILDNLSLLGVGPKTYNYVKNFLSDRVAQINFGESKSDYIELGSKGTPQGSVLSPLLFNVAMIGLPSKLAAIEGLSHCMYADDITMWIGKGTDGQIEETLQMAIGEVEKYVNDRGLRCSPQKSEMLFYQPNRKSRSDPPRISLKAQGLDIPTVDRIRVLGLYIQNNGFNGETIKKLEICAQQTMRLIRRIANRRYGMKETNLIRLVQAFVISKIAYVAPFLNLKAAEKSKLEGIIRRSVKQALGLPIRTPTAKLLELGLHNTLDEIVEGVTISQYERLSGSVTGRKILAKLGINYESQRGPKVDMLKSVRDRLNIPPLPKNMHPVHHKDRREKRAEALGKCFKNYPIEDVAYVDAANCGRGRMVIAVASAETYLRAGASITTGSPEIAEEAAIALAIVGTDASTIVSDSKVAVMNFAKGRVSPLTNGILRTARDDRKIRIVWTPAHASLAGNEAAHELARGLAFRASGHTEGFADRDRLVCYREITQHYRLNRTKYPAADKSLTKSQATSWRRLQTYTFPNPVMCSHYYPGQYSNECKQCKAKADLNHILWKCPFAPLEGQKIKSLEQWEALLLSSDPETQTKVVQLAEDAARSQDLLAVV